MENKNLLQEILKVSLGTDWVEQFEGEEILDELRSSVGDFLKISKADKVKFTIPEDSIDAIGLIEEDITSLTTSEVDFVNMDYCEFMNFAKSKIKNDHGSGWDSINREIISYDENFYFTGSDGTFYVLVEKVA